jgi:hypothetical protein
MIIGKPTKQIDVRLKRAVEVGTLNEVALLTQSHKSSRHANGLHTTVYGTLTRPFSGNKVAGSAIKIYKVVSNATGDGVYNCYEQKLLNAEWEDVGGAAKFDDKDASPVSVEVLNLQENSPAAAAQHNLSAGDTLSAWKMTDDDGTSRIVGIPLAGSIGTHIAYVKTTPGAVTEVDCYLDVDATGDEITVKCSIAGSVKLNAATPRIADGLPIFVQKFGDDWWCTTIFQKTEDCVCTAL